MTRIERLPSIIQFGLLSDNEVLRRSLAGVEIGYRHIKDRRAKRQVPCGAGGCLADYVPFYFAPRSPMLFAITKGRVSDEAARTEEIIYLETSTQTLRNAGLAVVASNRHAELAYAELSDVDARLTGDDFVDWPLMQARYWGSDPEDPDRKERRQAECLAHPAVPWSLVARVTAQTERAATRVQSHIATVGSGTQIAVRPDWYF